MYDPVALVSLPAPPTPPVQFDAMSGARHPVALCGFAATALLAIVFLALGLPAISVCMLTVSGISSFVLGSALGAASRASDRRHPWVIPEDIVSCELRASYRAILLGLAEVERALADAPRLDPSVPSVLDRCRTAVEQTGRMALLTNPLQHYLDTHDARLIRSTLDRLRARAEAASDDQAVCKWSHAVAARVRQLETIEQIAAKRDEICARLELVHAALESFAATIVRLHALDQEQIMLADESVTEQLAEIGSDLEVLEAALHPEIAA